VGKYTVAMVAFAVVLLASCSAADSESPDSSQPITPSEQTENSQTLTSTPSSTNQSYKPATELGPAENVPVPQVPKAAKSDSADGATAFALYYFSLINYAVETNDAEPLKQNSLRKCEICGTALIDPAGRAQITGKWQVGGKHHYKVVDSYMSSKNKATVSVRFDVDAAKFYLEPKKIDSTSDKSPSNVAALGLEFDSGWKVYTVKFEETGQ